MNNDMNRLTKKFNGEYYRKDVNTIIFNSETEYNAIQKLGKLEDIEDELGCPLDVVFRAFKEGIIINEAGYVNSAYDNKEFNAEKDSYYNCLTLSEVGDNYYFEDINHPYGDPECGDIGCCVRLSNYQKNWWVKGEKDEKAS